MIEGEIMEDFTHINSQGRAQMCIRDRYSTDEKNTSLRLKRMGSAACGNGFQDEVLRLRTYGYASKGKV